jgi:hypothetical protein
MRKLLMSRDFNVVATNNDGKELVERSMVAILLYLILAALLVMLKDEQVSQFHNAFAKEE